jgi:tRNA A-37 threonylcarbamoyl transferase component Bud32
MTMTEEIRRRGIPTAQVVAALCHRSLWPFYSGDLITKEIVGAKDLVSFLVDLGRVPLDERRALRRDIAQQAGRAVRFMHDGGVYHGDLNLRNLLVQTKQDGTSAVYIIDFDRSSIRDRLSINDRLKNLLRLNRSVEKWKTKGVAISYTDKARFFRTYAESHSDLIRAMKRHLKSARFHAGWYRLGWHVDRLLNPSRPYRPIDEK